MLRAILGLIAGFVCLTVFVAVGFAIVYLALGSERVFQEGSWAVTPSWILWTSIVGLIAAILSGAACALIAKRASLAPLMLIALIFVFGIGEAIYKHAVLYPNNEPPQELREDDFTMAEAANNAREPLYVSLLNPVIGVVGVFIGARLTGRSRKHGANAPS